MEALMWTLILMDTLACPHEGCDWSTSLSTLEGRQAALAAHLSRAH